MIRKFVLILFTISFLLILTACDQAEPGDVVSPLLRQSEANGITSLPPFKAKTAGGLAKTGQASTAQINTVVIPCPMNLPDAEVEGETVICGQITVPENWDDRGERTVNITYAILKADSLSPFPEPIIYLEGGPGGSALEDIEKLSEHFVKLRATRDVIFYDQRGTDYSGNLECPLTVQYAELADQDGDGADTEEPVDDNTDIEGPVDDGADAGEDDLDALFAALQAVYKRDPKEVLEEKRSQDNSAETGCYDYFVEQGIDLTQYNTTASIRDLTALMNGLEYDVYNVYGISYGSRLGLELMRAYEEEDNDVPEIRSVVIDGIDPPHVDMVAQAPFTNMYIVLDALSACEADDACAAAFPDISQRTVDLLAQAEEEPLQITSTDGITETVSVNQLAALLGGNSAAADDDFTSITSPTVIPYLPRLVDELSRGVGDVYLGLMSGALLPVGEFEQVLERNQFDPLAARTSQMAEEANTLGDELLALSAQMQRASEALVNDEPLPQLFVRELIHSVAEKPSYSGPGPLAQFAFIVLATNEPSRDNLEGALDAFEVDEGDKPLLEALIGMMSENEVEETYNLILSDRVKEQLAGLPLQQQMNTAVTCNDLYNGFDIGAVFDEYRNAEAPQMLNQIDLFVSYIVRCEHYGLTEGEGESSQPVTSSLPTLVVNGSVDKNTAARWGESAFEYLPNAQMVTVPLVAHGASALSACGQDITNAFFTYPGQEVNDSCTKALQPIFVLPEDDLGLDSGDGS